MLLPEDPCYAAILIVRRRDGSRHGRVISPSTSSNSPTRFTFCMSKPPLPAAKINSLLTRLRSNPKEARDPAQKYLNTVLAFVNTNNVSHLICDKADPVLVESSKFLLKLVDFNGDSAKQWRSILANCLKTCHFCSLKFNWLKESAKVA